MRPSSPRAGFGTLFLLTFGTVPVFVHGQSQPESALEVVQSTATRIQRSVEDVAQAVTVVRLEDASSPELEVLSEALRGTIGGFVQQTTPGQGSVIIRGLKGSQILHLVDGIRLNNALFRSAPNQYLALVDPFLAQSVDVLRGPSASLYGSDAMGGVVNVVTATPTFSSTPILGGAFRAGLSTADLGRALRGSFQFSDEGLAFQGGISRFEFGHRRTGDGIRLSDSDYRARSADGKLVLGVSDDIKLTVSGQYLKQPSTPRVDELVAGFGQSEPSSDAFFFEPNRRIFYHGRIDWSDPLSGVESLRVDVARQVIDDDRRTRDRGSVERQLETNSSELTGLTAQFTSRLDAGDLVYGFEAYRDEVSSRRWRQDLATDVLTEVAPRFPDQSRVNTLALFAHREWLFSGRWSLTTGLRYSRFRVRFDEASGQSNQLEPKDFSGDIGVRFTLSENIHLVANLGRGFRAPNIFDIGALGVRPGNRFNVLNGNLDPEFVTSVDIGIKANWAATSLEAFVFRSDYRDRITTVPTGEQTPEGRAIVRSENVGKVELYGAELGLTVQWGEATEFFLTANASRGTERQFGRRSPADRVPPVNARFGLRHQLQNRIWVETFVLANGRQNRLSDRDVADPRINPNGTPGWAVLDATAQWELSDELSLSFGLHNLLDKRYREHGSGIDARGRDLRFSVRWDF